LNDNVTLSLISSSALCAGSLPPTRRSLAQRQGSLDQSERKVLPWLADPTHNRLVKVVSLMEEGGI